MREFGVDEAGKGPVLGSMFAAAVVVDPADLPEDVGDSKGIQPSRRAELAETIRDRAAAVGVAEVPVERIDADGTDMNSLTVAAHAAALDDALADMDAPDPNDGDAEAVSGYVDACDANAVRFERRVADVVTASADLDLRAEHGADESYPVVGAASVVAKVERDAHVARLAETHGEVGSGYPSDPTTREFLESYVSEHGALPACARATWQTCDDVLAAASQSSLGEFETDDGPDVTTDGGTVVPSTEGSGASRRRGRGGDQQSNPDHRTTTLDEF